FSLWSLVFGGFSLLAISHWLFLNPNFILHLPSLIPYPHSPIPDPQSTFFFFVTIEVGQRHAFDLLRSLTKGLRKSKTKNQKPKTKNPHPPQWGGFVGVSKNQKSNTKNQESKIKNLSSSIFHLQSSIFHLPSSPLIPLLLFLQLFDFFF
ncbi:MAG: hypothetical protein KDC24_04280, partial [Saprospiraceae bacterium]|nr:hypothetical protein [Saprospiraceae bacterium]